jgi:hypothetical protein
MRCVLSLANASLADIINSHRKPQALRYRRLDLFPLIPCECITIRIGLKRMARTRTNIGRILVSALVFLMLCGIVATEFPELLTLTDCTRNDFTLGRADSRVAILQRCPNTNARLADLGLNIPAITLPYSRFTPFERATLVSSDAVTFRFVLRT